MQITQRYSHLNGEEYLLVRRPGILEQIEAAVQAVDAEKHRTKISKEKTMTGKRLYAPRELNAAFRKHFSDGWNSVLRRWCD